MLFIIVSGPAEEIACDASQGSILFFLWKETGHNEEMWKIRENGVLISLGLHGATARGKVAT